MSVMTDEDLANMSDEDFANLAVPPQMAAPASADAPDEPDLTDVPEEVSDDPAAAVLAESDDPVPGSAEDAPGSDDGLETDPDEPAAQAPAAAAGEDGAASGNTPADASEADGQDTQAPKAEAPVTDYKAAYEKIMAPFKANGKEIQLRSPEEAVQLMQMGANYTKKLQALQPNLKLLKMLENNGLLDEGKLGFLIDIDKKNPAAIQKLVKDSGIDPMDIDTQTDPGYKPGDHAVSDAEMRFTSTLEDIVSNQHGQSLVVEINKTWDRASKDALWEDPEVLRVLTEQKANGTFDAIKAEVERRRMLGYIGNVPFIRAYQQVGLEMQQQGRLGQPASAAAGSNQIPGSQMPARVVETRAAAPKTPSVAHGDKARAASSVRTKPQQNAAEFNPLALSDEDFEKYAALQGRL